MRPDRGTLADHRLGRDRLRRPVGHRRRDASRLAAARGGGGDRILPGGALQPTLADAYPLVQSEQAANLAQYLKGSGRTSC